MSTVGTWVVVATIALGFDLPSRWIAPENGAVALGLFLASYLVIQLPFDLLGGYLLPRRFGRAHLPGPRFAAALARGALVHGALLTVIGFGYWAAGREAGTAGAISFGIAATIGLLVVRPWLATAMARRRWVGTSNLDSDPLPTVLVDTDDEGFTGGIDGLWNPSRNTLPSHWEVELGREGLARAKVRRQLTAQSGAWRRGRWAAVIFTAMGITLATLAAGEPGTAIAVIETSLWFTLWSFLGLLVLPTLSRRSVQSLDEAMARRERSTSELEVDVRRLDALQDNEPRRSRWVESIFHPIPSADRRVDATRLAQPEGSLGFWDIARTAVYLSASGLGLLGRAVHCNCGRPALWAYLPTD